MALNVFGCVKREWVPAQEELQMLSSGFAIVRDYPSCRGGLVRVNHGTILLM